MSDAAFVSIRELVGLRREARELTFLPRMPIQSPLPGAHASRLRGRGLDFRELRAYVPGDDIRNIDWKVTARTRRPHTRVYDEERNRPALLLVDQRVNMFFGSRFHMKSVTAAHAAALTLWQVLAQGDQPGAIVFNDEDQIELRPARSESGSMAILHAIEKMNRSLRADDGRISSPTQLNRILGHAGRLAKHDHLIVLISDLDGFNEATRPLLNRLTQHNDVLVMRVSDPLERQLPEADRLVVSDGDLQLEFDAADPALRSSFARTFQIANEAGQKELKKRKVPMVSLGTEASAAGQLSALFGRRAQSRRP